MSEGGKGLDEIRAKYEVLTNELLQFATGVPSLLNHFQHPTMIQCYSLNDTIGLAHFPFVRVQQ